MVGKFCLEDSLDVHSMRAEFGKEIFWSQNAKEIITSKNGENFMVPIADGTVKLSGGIMGSEHPL